MLYKQMIASCFNIEIGHSSIDKKAFDTHLVKAEQSYDKISELRLADKFSLLNVLDNDDDLEELTEIVDALKQDFDELVVLGTGGSTLNPQTLLALKQPHRDIDKRVYFLDSVDPHTLEAFVEQTDLQNTAFVVISKSGMTIETLTQFLIFIGIYERAGILDLGRHFCLISDDIENPLRNVGKKIGANVIDHVKGIGGRFSAFTAVGLLPAMFAGINPINLRDGARQVINMNDNLPAIGAALSCAFMDNNININVMMPYIDRLAPFASWYSQIWAESLGKQGKGSTPIKAMGTLDQHSQLQLYLDGPKDKFFTLITLDTPEDDFVINNKYISDTPNLKYLQNKGVGQVSSAMQKATIDTLIANGCPVREIRIHELDEKVLGALIIHFMLETVIVADMLGVNAFDQPAVEQGKNLARKILIG